MINHVFKLVWNRRKSYLGIFAEQMLITFILMFCIVQFARTIQKILSPGLLDTHNTVVYGNDFRKGRVPDGSVRIENHYILTENLRKLPFVEAITNSFGLTPFFNQRNRIIDSIRIDNKKIKFSVKGADEYSAIVFRIKMLEGVWLADKALNNGSYPAIITRQFADDAGWTNSLGKKIQYKTHTYTVTGVIEGIKDNLYEPSTAAIILPVSHFIEKGNLDMPVARVTDKESFYSALYAESNRLYAEYKNTLLVASIDMMKQGQILESSLTLILASIPTLFLTIFAFIGTFGVFNLHAKRHLKEYALRIATGSPAQNLLFLVISESLLITCLAMLPALLLSFFIYDYTSTTDWAAIFVTAGIMLLFSTISAWYPAWKVSRVNPAEALQYE